jgi:hypothetical protein
MLSKSLTNQHNLHPSRARSWTELVAPGRGYAVAGAILLGLFSLLSHWENTESLAIF